MLKGLTEIVTFHEAFDCLSVNSENPCLNKKRIINITRKYAVLLLLFVSSCRGINFLLCFIIPNLGVTSNLFPGAGGIMTLNDVTDLYKEIVLP